MESQNPRSPATWHSAAASWLPMLLPVHNKKVAFTKCTCCIVIQCIGVYYYVVGLWMVAKSESPVENDGINIPLFIVLFIGFQHVSTILLMVQDLFHSQSPCDMVVVTYLATSAQARNTCCKAGLPREAWQNKGGFFHAWMVLI